MSDLKTRIYDDVKTAMKAGEKERLAMLRMLTAELKQREVVESTELTDAVVQGAVEKMIKQRRDSESQFRNGNRPELADKEAAEVGVLEAYLPQRMGADEIAAEVKAIVAELGAKGPGDMGKVMGAVKQRLVGKAEMGQVSAAVKAALAGNA